MPTGSSASRAGGCSSGPKASARTARASQPVAAIGPVDQHSQLQLYLAGPSDKLFTVITTGVAGQGPVIDAKLAKRAGEPEFAGKRIGDLVAAQGRATADTLASNGRPTRAHPHRDASTSARSANS